MSYRTALAFMALTTAVLVGCNQPVGLPNNRVHAASTTTVYCYLADTTDDQWSGHLDLFSGYMSIDSCIDSITPIIRRGYFKYQNRPYPRQIGYAVFWVPEFDASNGTVVCTLNYYQSAHNDYPTLEVRDMCIAYANPAKETLYWRAWDSNVVMATDNTHQQDGWYKVALTSEGVDSIVSLGTRAGALYTGWVFPGTRDSAYTEVYGATSGYSPYIKVVVTK